MNQDPFPAPPAPSSRDDLPDAEQVAAFLRCHPEFLCDRPDLVNQLSPPSRWSDDAVVDLQQFMVQTLRQELDGLRACTHEVIETSRQNMALQARTHDAALTLLEAGDVDTLLRAVSEDLPVVLDVDVALVALEPGGGPAVYPGNSEIQLLEAGDVDHLVGGHGVVLLDRLADGGPLFAGAASLVRSAALARLGPLDGCPNGVLALGSRHAETFHPRQGADLLRFLARVLTLCLQRTSSRGD